MSKVKQKTAKMELYVQDKLFALQDKGYQSFHSKLIPTVEATTVIGVRTPAMRKLAKSLKQDPLFREEEFLSSLPHAYYEENNLQGFLIELEKDYESLMKKLEVFLPYIDNWATCDLISPKCFKKHPEEVLCKIQQWLGSDAIYTQRFAMRMLMNFYLEENFRPEYLDWVGKIRSEEYYLKMMIAWFFATALAKQYEATLPILLDHRLDRWCHNKTIQKAIESYRITPEQKAYLRTLRRK